VGGGEDRGTMKGKIVVWRGLLVLLMMVGVCGLQVRSLQAADYYGTYGFGGLTNNDPCNIAVGEAQLFVDVLNGGSEVTFIFRNEGPDICSITDVYFDDGTLLELTGLWDLDDPVGGPFGDPNVDFSPGATPSELPGANLIFPAFETSLGFSADSDPPPPSWGVEPGQWLGVLFSLDPNGTPEDVIDELNDGTLRIGLHVQAFGNGGIDSESFVNVPEPASMLLLTVGGLTLLRKRKPR